MTAALLDGLADDLDTAFPQLVRQHQDAVFGVALRSTGHWQDAEEIAQEAFVRAYAALRGYDADRIRELSCRAWLLRITVNLARNRVRDAARRPRTADLDGAVEIAGGDGAGPEASAMRAEDGRRLAAALATLRPAHREAVVLRHVAGLGYAEIAEAMDSPVGTVKAQVHRGLRSLAAALGGATGEEP